MSHSIFSLQARDKTRWRAGDGSGRVKMLSTAFRGNKRPTTFPFWNLLMAPGDVWLSGGIRMPIGGPGASPIDIRVLLDMRGYKTNVSNNTRRARTHGAARYLENAKYTWSNIPHDIRITWGGRNAGMDITRQRVGSGRC
jgi:hypothetical protein